MKSEIINIIEKIEHLPIENWKDKNGRKASKIFYNKENNLLIKICESESMQANNTCWQDMDIDIKEYIDSNNCTFIYYFIWKSRYFYRQSLNKSNFSENGIYISPNRDKYIFYFDAQSAENGESAVGVYTTRNKREMIFSMTKVEITDDDIDSIVNKSSEGFVYMIKNRAFREGITKIGCSKDWRRRISELYDRNTSIPLPFEPLCVIKVPNMSKAENYFHNALQRWAGIRINPKREFFDFGERIKMVQEEMKDYAKSVGGEIISIEN